MTYPAAGENEPLTQILLGMADAYSGLNVETLIVTAEIDGHAAGSNLVEQFTALSDGRWQWKLSKPLSGVEKATLKVLVQDRQGNLNEIERAFSAK